MPSTGSMSSPSKTEAVRAPCRSSSAANRPFTPPSDCWVTASAGCGRSWSHLVSDVIPEATWRLLDPDGRTLRDIDTPADLP